MRPTLAWQLSFGATFIAPFVGSAASIQASSFYAELEKPFWAPPSRVFGPVWTVLYVMMAIAGGLALSGVDNSRTAGRLFFGQLGLNALWSWTFLKWESGAWSMTVIVILWIAIFATTVAFWRKNRRAGALMLPYLGWVTVAAFLNATIWRLNPGAL